MGGRMCGRLGFRTQLDCLRIAAALEIEDAFRAPTALVVTDQRAPGIGRQSCFPGSRQTEEYGRIILRAAICRTMHRHDVLSRKKVIQRRKDGLLDFAGIRTSPYQDDLSRKIHRDHRFAAHPVALGIRLEGRAAVNRELRKEGREFAPVWPEQQRADEKGVPSKRCEDARAQPEFRIGASAKVLGIQSLAGGVSNEVLVQSRKLRGGHLAVVFPPDGLLRLVVTDDIFVFWAAAGVHAGFGAQRATRRDLCFTVLEGAFVQFGFEEIPVQPFEISEPEFVCPEFRVACALFQHFVSPWAWIRTCMLCRRRQIYCRMKADAGAATPNHSRQLWKTSPCNTYWRPHLAYAGRR